MKIVFLIAIGLFAFITAASAQVTPLATPAIPTIGQFQSALSGLQTAAADLSAAWTALQPVLSFVGSCAALAALIPHPSAGSIWTLPRGVLDIFAANVGHAKNVESSK